MRHPRSMTITFALAVALGCQSASDPGNGPDPEPPSVIGVVPPAGASNVSTTAPVVVTFSGPVDVNSVTTDAFRVGTVTGSIAVVGTTATFTPSAPYPYGATLAVSVSGVRDLDGLVMESGFSSSFTVVPQPTVPPAANAGPDRQISAGSTISIDATASTGTNLVYAWTQIEGTAVAPLSGPNPSFTAPSEIGRLRFELALSGDGPISRDTVTLYVLEDGANAYFVAPTGSDAAAGTRAAPFATVQHAIDVADAAGNGGDVYIAAGVYAGSITLRSRVSLYGGFEPAGWTRDIAVSRPTISGGRIAMRGADISALTLEGVRVESADAADSSQSSIALLFHNSADVRVRRSEIVAGDGFRGRNGATGNDPAKTDNGNNGLGAAVCPPTRAGGSGGESNVSRAGGAGGNGGLAGGFGGTDGQGTSGGSGGNGGGAFGGNGTSGSASTASRTNGSGGQPGTGFGTLSPADVVAAVAPSGGGGQNGWGGGGGGGGGGGLGCGGGGGGGGAGGIGGGGGAGGHGGGHSIGVALSGTTTATIEDVAITLGQGGQGGTGGRGGSGGTAGSGGSGGGSNASGGAGGNGASGTSGAHGGGGGGGAGGSAIGVVEAATASSTRNSVTVTPGTPGAGGAGGPRSGGNAGSTGTAGEAAEFKKLS